MSGEQIEVEQEDYSRRRTGISTVATRSRSPRRQRMAAAAAPQQTDRHPAYSVISPQDWRFQRSSMNSNYYNVICQGGDSARNKDPTVFAFFKDLEWSQITFEPKKEERRPFMIKIDVASEDQMLFLKSIDVWAKEQIATHSEEILGSSKSASEVDILDIYRKPWYEPLDDKYSPRIEARVVFSGPRGFMTEITLLSHDIDAHDAQNQKKEEDILKGAGEDHFNEVQRRLGGKWRDHLVRAILRVDSLRVYEDKAGQRKVALQFDVKELIVKQACKKKSSLRELLNVTTTGSHSSSQLLQEASLLQFADNSRTSLSSSPHGSSCSPKHTIPDAAVA